MAAWKYDEPTADALSQLSDKIVKMEKDERELINISPYRFHVPNTEGIKANKSRTYVAQYDVSGYCALIRHREE